jgi:ribosomal protein S11
VRARKLIILLAGAPVALSLSGCLGVETTPEKSAKAAAKAKNAVTSQKGLEIGAANAQVEVEDAALVQDSNGVAAIVRLKNTGSTQVTLPIALTVSDAKGKKLYANDAPGLDPSLTSVAVLKAGEETDWVNNQILVAGKAAKAVAQVGRAKGKAVSGALPKIAIAGVTHDEDEDGFFAQGTLKNESSVSQKRLVVTCVARDGGKVIAAGRAVVDRLDPFATTKKPTKFNVYFIGDPKSAELDCAAPPTVLS